MTDCKECERLKADYRLLSESYHELREQLAQAKAELDAWQSTCGTRQNHVEDVEKLKAKNARLAAIVGWISKQSNPFFAECDQAGAIVARCKEVLASTNKQTKRKLSD